MLAGNDAYIPPAFESIASATGTGSSGVITFSSIPGDYQHLQIRLISRASAGGNNIRITFNSDTTASYARHSLGGNGSSANTGGQISVTYMEFDDFTADSGAGANVVAAGIIDIHDYASTTKNKTVRGIGAFDNNGSGSLKMMSGLWVNTSAITSITLTHSASNFTTASQFALYGVKGA
jgi:hypothetical protein